MVAKRWVFFRNGYNELTFLCNGTAGMKFGQKKSIGGYGMQNTIYKSLVLLTGW